MSDAQPAAEAVSNNPAESVKVEGEDAAMPDNKTEASSAEVSKTEANDDEIKSGDKEAANGDSSIKKEESSPARKDNSKQNGSRYNKGTHNNRGGRNYGKNNNNSRTNEFENLPESDDPVEIRAQVEFYFSVQNLSTDQHLFMQCEGPKNRPVPIKHINNFSRMRHFKPYSAVVDALRESEDLVVVDDGEFSGIGNEGVKRKEPLTCPTRPGDDKHPPTTEDLFERVQRASINRMENSVYVKGFVEDGGDVGQIALEHFFKPYGAVMIRKRRDKDDNNRWKGSVFVEFDTEDSQQQFLSLDPMPKFQDRDLTVMSKKDYSEMKCKEKGITPAWERPEGEYTSSRRGNGRGRGRGDGRGRGRGRGGSRGRGGNDRFGRDRDRNSRRDRSHSRGSEDSRDWNKRRDRFQKGERRQSVERDHNGVPVIQDTRTAEEKAASKKRKTDDAEHGEGQKKSKIEIKEDE